MKSNNIIEINGHRYDAQTGLPLDDAKKAIKNMAKSAGKFIDGYRPQISKPASKNVSEKSSPTNYKATKTSRAASPNVSHKTKRSTTLNRSTVKRPANLDVTTAKPKNTAIVTPELTNNSRFTRAATIAKSSAISRFHKESSTTNTPKEAAVSTSKSARVQDAKSATQPSTKERLIHQAVASATAHEAVHTKKQRKHRHFGRYITTAAVALLLVAYVAYLNVPSLSMKVAAHRAGFAATLPGYRPSGYILNGPIAYTSGQVVVNFRSNTDDRKFTLKQQPTNWDSTALVENYITKQTPNYLTYQDSGLTIYIFNGSSAAWVNAGKLYNLDGKNSELDTDQVLKLATSV